MVDSETNFCPHKFVEKRCKIVFVYPVDGFEKKTSLYFAYFELLTLSILQIKHTLGK